jgi:hypothetical protein
MNTRSERGQPARYHNATCRQRARRARIATNHHAALTTLAALETATSALRHAILTNNDITAAHRRITGATAELTKQLLPHVPQTPDLGPPDKAPVTKPVTTEQPTPGSAPVPPTEPEAKSRAEEQIAQPEPAPANPCAGPVIKTVNLSQQIGPGWTLTQHADDAEISLWHVQYNGRTLGTVRRSYDLTSNTRGWEARTANFDHVRAFGALSASRRHDRLWRTRDNAAAGIASRAAKLR